MSQHIDIYTRTFEPDEEGRPKQVISRVAIIVFQRHRRLCTKFIDLGLSEHLTDILASPFATSKGEADPIKTPRRYFKRLGIYLADTGSFVQATLPHRARNCMFRLANRLVQRLPAKN